MSQLIVVQILDIDEENTVSIVATIRAIDLCHATEIRSTINALISSLRRCPAKTHTRLFMLDRTLGDTAYSYSLLDIERKMRLLFAHLLGVELGLCIPEVLWFLAFAGLRMPNETNPVHYSDSGTRAIQRTPRTDNTKTILLSDDANGSFGAVRWLGRCKVEHAEPFAGE